MTLTISPLSLQYVLVQVRAREDGEPVDPTGDTVELAFLTSTDSPEDEDWKAGSWETDDSGAAPVYYARCLVGPGGDVTLVAARWHVWVRVTSTPEVPVLLAGIINVST